MERDSDDSMLSRLLTSDAYINKSLNESVGDDVGCNRRRASLSAGNVGRKLLFCAHFVSDYLSRVYSMESIFFLINVYRKIYNS